MLKAAIFDLNGVFILSPKLSDRFEKDFGVSAATFLPKLGEIMDAVRKPDAAPAFTYWKPVLDTWGVTFTEDAFWQYWFGAERPDEKMVALAKELRGKGVIVVTLSNNFKERAAYYDHYPWMHEAVDRAYFSWETGLVKPDCAAWERVLNDFKLEPDEVLYFDDQEKNLEAARNLGITAHLYVSPEKAREVIEALE